MDPLSVNPQYYDDDTNTDVTAYKSVILFLLYKHVVFIIGNFSVLVMKRYGAPILREDQHSYFWKNIHVCSLAFRSVKGGVEESVSVGHLLGYRFPLSLP